MPIIPNEIIEDVIAESVFLHSSDLESLLHYCMLYLFFTGLSKIMSSKRPSFKNSVMISYLLSPIP